MLQLRNTTEVIGYGRDIYIDGKYAGCFNYVDGACCGAMQVEGSMQRFSGSYRSLTSVIVHICLLYSTITKLEALYND